jgi:hypothetical protein
VSVNKIYGFKHFRAYLEERKYVFKTRPETILKIEKKDFTNEEKKGNIYYEEDGIYLLIDGIKHLGYLSMKDYDITGLNKYPSFHTVECSTIKQFKQNGLFDKKYDFYNTKNVDILDRHTQSVHKSIDLKLCTNCKNQTKNQIYSTTTGFHEELVKYNQKLVLNEVKLDLNNRPFDWNKMSKEYKKYKEYQCECCSFNGLELNAFDKRFIEVDHIKAWELCNLNEENLQCLCVLCHSQKDTVHQKNYSKGANLKKVKEFVKKFKNVLEKCANPYLKDWLLKYPEQ